MELRIRKGRSGYENDTIGWGSAPKLAVVFGLWRPGNDEVRMLTVDMLPEVLLDVQRAQVGKKVTSLDVTVSQHTTVDYIRLTLVY